MARELSQVEYNVYSDTFDKVSLPGSHYVQGDAAREVLMKSGLPTQTLFKIWNLADVDKRGELSKDQFILALHLARTAMETGQLPDTLPVSLLNKFNPRANTLPRRYTDSESKLLTQTSLNPPLDPSFEIDSLSQDFEKRFPSFGPINEPTPVTKATPSVVSSPAFDLNSTPSIWKISETQRKLYTDQYKLLDPSNVGYISGESVRTSFLSYSVPVSELSQIWKLVDTRKDGNLNKEDFISALHILKMRLQGASIPSSLPKELSQTLDRLLDASIPRIKQDLMNTNLPSATSQPNNTQNRTTSNSQSTASKYAFDNDIVKSSKRYVSDQRSSSSHPQTSNKTSSITTDVSGNLSSQTNSITNLQIDLLSQIKNIALDTWDLDEFAYRQEHDSNPHTPRPSTDSLFLKRQKLVVKAFSLLLLLNNLKSKYSSKIALKQSQLNSSANQTKDSPSLKNQDTASKAAARIAARMKALTGDDYDPNLGSPSQGQSPAIDSPQNEIATHKKNIELLSNQISDIKESLVSLGLGSIFDSKEIIHLTSIPNLDSINIPESQISSLIADLKTIKGKHIKDSDIVPEIPASHQSSFVSKDQKSEFESTFELNNRDLHESKEPSAKLNTPSSISSNPQEDKSQRLKRLAELKFKERQRALGLIIDDDEDSYTSGPNNNANNTNNIASTSSKDIQTIIPSDHNVEKSPFGYESPFSAVAKSPTQITRPLSSTTKDDYSSDDSDELEDPFSPNNNKPDHPDHENIFSSFESQSESVFQTSSNQGLSPNQPNTYEVQNIPTTPFQPSNSLSPEPTTAKTNPFLKNSPVPKTESTTSTNPVDLSSSTNPQSPSNDQFQSTAATIYSKLFGSPNDTDSNRFKGSLEYDIDESDSSESSFDFDVAK
ncbi:hypothetical protein BB560_001901 [Smittium megazygosporum]|uniref:Actin cytoskeleton-regulatory complex protein pan1 n=1 Tax=Smittium megazygosporum TaxID=133381 RepID=A0A2T9ZGB5_9FUNG|nr:hypothetical protein BB560_001901 [Smittium megazygosporum]